MSEASTPEVLTVLRTTHDRLAAAFDEIGEDVTRPSYDDDWSVAQVASHLGSGTEIFRHYLDAGVAGQPTPGPELNQPIWDAWNAKPPAQQVSDALAVSAGFLDAVEALDAPARERWRLEVFGMDQDLAAFLRMRLNEQALHTWDVTVALDPSSTIPADAASIVLDGIGMVVGWAGRPTDEPASVEVHTSDPERACHLALGPSGVALTPSLDDTDAAELSLPAEAFVRLVYGRLDPDHTPASVRADGVELALLRRVFPGL
jgi:uncharacterized protein (TIGR03083 family)